jgi:hypothetical protein
MGGVAGNSERAAEVVVGFDRKENPIDLTFVTGDVALVKPMNFPDWFGKQLKADTSSIVVAGGGRARP